jgi:glycosyltransferase involved in cell wall biosynthesis
MNVSIVIPAYNAAETIGETLHSILDQSDPNWEAIVVDDGSSDRTTEIAGHFVKKDSRIRLIHRPSGGESAARNSGIAEARYNWLLFLDADDWIAPAYLERMTGELIAHPELDAVHCGSARVAPDRTMVVESYLPPTGDMFAVWARRSAFPVHACVVRRSLVEAVGRFDPSLRKSPDWDLWQRIARMGARFGAVREILAFYRMRPNAASLDAHQMLLDGLRVLKQGHAPDPRVPNPHPDHAAGSPPEEVRTQEFYLLSWCAGLLLGNGKDARPLLEWVKEDHFPELYPDAVAECIFGAAPLPTCQSPQDWERLWPKIQQRVSEFLVALEAQSMAPDLARKADDALKIRILKHSPTWQSVIGDYERIMARLEKERGDWQGIAGDRARTVEEQRVRIAELEQSRTVSEGKTARLEKEVKAFDERVKVLSAERDGAFNSPERRIGDLLLNRLRLRGPIEVVERAWVTFRHHLAVTRLAAEGRLTGRGLRRRVLATVCHDFPIYSQTFVYQELTQLARQGFDIRLVYSRLDSPDYLHPHFSVLWKGKRRLFLHSTVHKKDFEWYRARMPEKVGRLIEILSKSSGMDRRDLIRHGNFLQAFSFTRMAEAYRPHYLHSYFFYDRSLMALVAGYLLGIPRGISCYADHLLKDYELKVVPLHLELCDIIVATSERIKRELLEIAPRTDPDRVLVKPNGIDTECYPIVEQAEPPEGAPFRLVSVCRIEPKKGLIDLVEAVSLLRRRGLAVEAHLVGTVDEWSQASRDYKRKLDQRISELNLWGRVHLEGRQNLDGLLRFLGLAHIFVAPFVETESGDKDGIPTSLLEAMSSGLPSVATDAGSILEVIEDGREGRIVPQRDPKALAAAIADLIGDPEQRKRFGHNAARKVRERFDVSVCEKIFHSRLKEVMGGHRVDQGMRV